MRGLLLDVRYALRAMRRTPSFTAIAVGCLAAGIGVNATAFSMLDALLWRDLPGVERQHEVHTVMFSWDTPWGRREPGVVSALDWEMFRGGIPAFRSSGVMGTTSVALRRSGEALAVRADFVSGAYFELLGTRPAAGRLLSPDDDQPGAAPAVVISHDLWESDFARSPDAVGQTLYVGTTAFTIVGVTPEGFVGLYPGELVADPEHGAPWLMLPLAAAPLVRSDSRHASTAEALADDWLLLIGRRQSGATPADVEAQANLVAARLAAEYPEARAGMTAEVRAPSTASGPQLIAIVGFVMAVPAVILLVACANLANQLLARGVRRGREIAVRLSLGASRGRVVRQLLVESLLLALAASVAAVYLARAVTDAVGTFVLVMPFRIPIDVRVVAFSVAVAFLTALVFGLVPALRATRMDIAQAVKEGGAGGGYRRSRLRSALVVTQVGASVALLALAGVFGRASLRGTPMDSDGNANRVLTVAVDLDLLGYAPSEGGAFQALAMERLNGVQGVEAVALARFGPAATVPEDHVAVAGDPPERHRYHNVAAVAGDWFAALGQRPLAGRLFSPSEARGGAQVAVVDDAAAADLWPDESAVGQTLSIGHPDSATHYTVIGVVPALPEPRGESPEGLIVVASTGAYAPRAHFHIRTRGAAADHRAVVRDALRSLEPRLPVANGVTYGESFARASASLTQLAAGVGAMAAIALLLAALGLWAVLSYLVEQRRYEIGVRVALGAGSNAVTWMVVRQSLGLAGVGAGVGAVVAGVSATAFRSLLFGLPPIDPVAFGGAIAILLVVALLASAAPARRAAAVDPTVALRAE